MQTLAGVSAESFVENPAVLTGLSTEMFFEKPAVLAGLWTVYKPAIIRVGIRKDSSEHC